MITDLEFPNLPNAACRDADPEEFFPGDDGRRPTSEEIRLARTVCGRCPERIRCMEWAIGAGEQGIWGGTTDEERRGVKRKQKRPLTRDERRRAVASLYTENLSDGAIAQKLHVSRTVVQNDRAALGLVETNTVDLTDRRAKVARLHATGLNDREISSILGLTREQARNDRVILGLPQNHRKAPAA